MLVVQKVALGNYYGYFSDILEAKQWINWLIKYNFLIKKSINNEKEIKILKCTHGGYFTGWFQWFFIFKFHYL